MNLPLNRGKPWTTSDETELQAMFLAGVSLHHMAYNLNRKPSATVSRLCQLGILAGGVDGFYMVTVPWVTHRQLKEMER